jgi:hypothetical protein
MTTPEKSYTLGPEEKATPLMVYTQHHLSWGELVSKELVRVSTWLRTPTAPNYLTLRDAQVLYAAGSAVAVPCRELYIPAQEVLAYHMLPPAADPPDYDPQEPNRKLEPVTVLLGAFRFDGHLRMASSVDLGRFLDVMSEKWTSFYEVTISLPQRPNMKPVHVPYVLLRRDLAQMLNPR